MFTVKAKDLEVGMTVVAPYSGEKFTVGKIEKVVGGYNIYDTDGKYWGRAGARVPFEEVLF